MEPKIIFEDEFILVIEKPAGITVNTSDTTKGERTIQDWVEQKLKIVPYHPSLDSQLDGTISDFYKRGGIVHRLDKETSGLLIIAKNEDSFRNLQMQFKERMVKKTYKALVHGNVVPDSGEIQVPVGRLPWNRKRFGVVAGGREAVTRYRVESKFQNQETKEQLTLLELYPETGRTHQIRVHLKHIGHPIVSDFLYAGRKTMRVDRKQLDRVFLHASTISFTHPSLGEKITFNSPLGKDLGHYLGSLTQLN